MSAHRYLDPTTRDHVVVNGSPRSDDSEASCIVWLLGLERGTLAADANLGSRLHTLRYATRDALALAPSYVAEALEPRVRAGAISDLSTSPAFVDLPGGGKALDLVVSYRDRRRTQRSVPYRHIFGG
jgi:phage gp46-like protein